MTPEATYLLAAMQGNSAPAPADTDQGVLLSLAQSHGLLPLLCRSQASSLPQEFALTLREKRAHCLLLTSDLESILSHFAQHRLQVLALKGPILSKLLYRQVSLRSSGDLDLLVRPCDFARAELLLMDLGFVPTGEVDDYHRGFEGESSFVELHFHTSSPSTPRLDFAAAWARSWEIQFRGSPVRILAPIDLVLYLALHGLKHRFARMIWVLDVANSLAALDEDDRGALLDHAAAQSLRNVLLLSCAVARRSLAISLPEDLAEAIAAQPALDARAQKMADAILTSDADPTQFIDDPGFYLSLADRSANRWKQRVSFFLPTQRDHRMAKSCGLSPKFAPLLRPIRILRNHGAERVLRTLFPGSGKEQ